MLGSREGCGNDLPEVGAQAGVEDPDVVQELEGALVLEDDLGAHLHPLRDIVRTDDQQGRHRPPVQVPRLGELAHRGNQQMLPVAGEPHDG
jgi:hypothetical protein